MEDERLVIKRRGDDGYRIFSIRVREDILTRIDEIAADSGRSRNEIIGILLDYAVNKCSIE